MKKLLALSFILISYGAVAQTETGKTVERMKIYKKEKSSPTTTSETEKKEMTVDEEIAYCEGVILALDEKEAAIRSNPEELKTATKEGWFIDAENTRKEMTARINELKNK